MAKVNLFAWASISENGTVNGKAGDQTGSELKVGPYYDFGQDRVIRIKSLLTRRKCAKIAKKICNSRFCGYSQNDRMSLYCICKKHDWNYDEIVKLIDSGKFPKCNTDCSALASVCINIAFGKEIIPCCTTRSIEEFTATKHPDKFKVISVAKAKSKWYKADMPLKAGKHIIINV